MATGIIRNAQIYGASKIVDYSDLIKVLPRNIAPSDLDMVLDNAGYILFGDYKSHKCGWNELPTGQQILFKNLLRLNPEKVTVVILWHTPELTGDNLGQACLHGTKDLLGFQTIRIVDGEFKVSKWYDGRLWKTYVEAWFKRR